MCKQNEDERLRRNYATVYNTSRIHCEGKLERDVGMDGLDRSKLMISVMATRAICSTVILNKSSILRPTEAQSIRCTRRALSFKNGVGEGLFTPVSVLSAAVKEVSEAGQRGEAVK
ncbi:unnamed protein product, partial [Brenthis ino]